MNDADLVRPAVLALVAAAGIVLFVGGLPDRFSASADIEPLGADPTHLREDLVFAIQDRLALRGFDPGPIDGVAGQRTIDAIQAFDAWSGRDGADRISGELLRALDQWP